MISWDIARSLKGRITIDYSTDPVLRQEIIYLTVKDVLAMSKDPYCSMCIFASEEGSGRDRSCFRCQMIPGRPNFISIYRDGRRPKVSEPPRESKESIRRKTAQRISSLVRSTSKDRRYLDKRKVATWGLITRAKC
jgi:hypothetical protein